MVGCLLAMAYFIFKLARMYQADQAYKYKYTRNFLTFFGTTCKTCDFSDLIYSCSGAEFAGCDCDAGQCRSVLHEL